MNPTTLVYAALAAAAATVFAIGAATILDWEAEKRETQKRIQSVLKPGEAKRTGAAGSTAAGALGSLFRSIGEAMRSAFSERDIVDLERTVAAAGFDPRRMVSTFIGVKVVLLVVAPGAAYATAMLQGEGIWSQALYVCVGLILGVMMPNWAVGFMRRPYLAALRRGLPDALDLMVVCAEAGLGLDTAVDRVAKEMEASYPAISVEFATLSQELKLMPDRRQALARMGERTGVEGFQRLAATLGQTLRYGTPLTQALRVLASEMRQERLTKLEEKAARLPALLVLPLVLFIMPCLFIVLIGPSIIQLMKSFGN